MNRMEAARRIEELNKTANGNVEARVMCFHRRSELPQSLLTVADKHHWGDSTFGLMEQDPDSDEDEDATALAKEKAERAAFKLREVFLSRQVRALVQFWVGVLFSFIVGYLMHVSCGDF